MIYTLEFSEDAKRDIQKIKKSWRPSPYKKARNPALRIGNAAYDWNRKTRAVTAQRFRNMVTKNFL